MQIIYKNVRQLNNSDYLENFKLPTHTVYTNP